MSRRNEKVGDQLQLEIADLLHREVKHPLLVETMLSITRVEISQDFSRARVLVSVMGEDDDESGHEAVIEALRRTEPFLHRELVKRLRMRRIPRLQFVADFSIVEGDRVRALMRDLSLHDDPGD